MSRGLCFPGLASLSAYENASRSKRKRHDDLNLSAFVQTELEDVIPTLYDKKYRDLDAQYHVPVSTNVNPGAMSWAYDSYEKRGKAEFLGANANQFPRADVAKERVILPIRTIVSSYGWSIEEIEASRFAGTELDRRKAEAARRGIAELEHATLLNGSAPRKIPGFLTNPVTPLITLPNGAWLTTATADQIIQDMNAVCDQIWIGTNRVHRANTILLPMAHYRKVQTTRLPNTGLTIMDFFMRSNPYVNEVMPLIELSTAGAGGTARIMAYEKLPENLSGIIPLAFQQLDPQVQGFEVLIPVRERLGGATWFYPMAGAFADGA